MPRRNPEGPPWVPQTGREITLSFFGDDADRSVALEHCEFDFFQRTNALGPGGGSHIFTANLHLVHDLGLPFSILDDDQRDTINNSADSRVLTLCPRQRTME